MECEVYDSNSHVRVALTDVLQRVRSAILATAPYFQVCISGTIEADIHSEFLPALIICSSQVLKNQADSTSMESQSVTDRLRSTAKVRLSITLNCRVPRLS